MVKLIVHLTIDGVIETEGAEKSIKVQFTEELGKQLRFRRLAKGLNLLQLGQMSGVSSSHLGRIERGERAPGSRILAKIEQALGGGEGE